MVDFADSFFDITSGGKQTKELISRCTALMQLSIPTIRQFGLKGGTFFASGSGAICGRRAGFCF